MLVALDIFCLLLVSIPTVLSESSMLAPHIQGFFCDDDTTIKYPRVAHYIIKDSALITIGFFISVKISLGEVIRVRGLHLSSVAFMSSTYVATVYKQLSAFIFGGMAGSSLTCIAKMTTRHLRPHFLAMCLPYPASFNCESSYITDYTCTGHPEDILNARKSYSEHASSGMYSIVYLVLYVQASSWGQKTWLLPPTIQLLFLSLALLTGYIRILGYGHHPYNTVVRFLQGALMAFWVAFYTSQAMPGPSSSRC